MEPENEHTKEGNIGKWTVTVVINDRLGVHILQ